MSKQATAMPSPCSTCTQPGVMHNQSWMRWNRCARSWLSVCATWASPSALAQACRRVSDLSRLSHGLGSLAIPTSTPPGRNTSPARRFDGVSQTAGRCGDASRVLEALIGTGEDYLTLPGLWSHMTQPKQRTSRNIGHVVPGPLAS